MGDPKFLIVMTDLRKLSFNKVEELTSSHREGPGPEAQRGFTVPKTNAISITKALKKIMPEPLEKASQLKDLEVVTLTVDLFYGKILI